MPAQTLARAPRSRSTLALVAGIASVAAAVLLLFGAVQRTGRFGSNPIWEAWAEAGSVVRFVTVLSCLVALIGGASLAFTLTWKRQRHLDLVASCALLLAGIALLVGATYQPQYGASQATAFVLMAFIGAGFIAVLLSAYKRFTVKDPGAEAQVPEGAKSQ